MNISKTEVTACDSELLNNIWEIYDISFPSEEKRTLLNLKEIMSGENCKTIAYHIMNRVIGFIIYWEYPNFKYIEYFAVSTGNRGKGYGKCIINDFIDESGNKPLILEIDEILDEVSKSRFYFYSREGFVMNDITHTPTSYNDINHRLNLHILTYGNTITKSQYDDFNKVLVDDIMSNIYQR